MIIIRPGLEHLQIIFYCSGNITGLIEYPTPENIRIEEPRIDIDSTSYTVQGEPVRDRERLIWTAELVPA